MPPKVDPKSQRSVFADLAKQIADHQARIQVIAANWAETITEHLNATEKKLLAAIAKELANFKFRPNAKETLVKLKRIHTILRKLRLKGWKAAQEAIEREARELAANEAKWAQKVAKVTSDPKDAAKLKEVSGATLDKVVKFGLADGKTVNEYFDQLADDEAVRLESTIRQGVESGWTIDQMTRNIAGTAQNDYTDGLLNVTKNAAKMMARTLTNAIANNAKDAFYQENAEIIPQVEILATLDGRTCISCASLDRKRYKTGEPHPALPVHQNCRCVLLPVTILSDLVEEQRPMARSDFMADAKRRYEAKYPGKKWEDLSESTRKKYYYKEMREYERTTGQSAYTQVSGGMSFKDYFQNEMTDQQRQDWLGPEKFKLWKKGNMPLDRFIPPYPDKAMTVRELKRLDQESFALYGAKGSKNSAKDRWKAAEEYILYETDNITRYSPRKGQEQWDIIPEEVKKILRHEKVKDVPKNFMTKNNGNYDGFVGKKADGTITEWSVSNNAETPALTAVHETGHLLDFSFMNAEQRKKILGTIKESEEYKVLKARYDKINPESKEGKKLGNWLKDEELLARGYAQYISQKNGGDLLAQLEKDATLGVGRVFFSKSDEIKSLFDTTIQEVGL